MVFLASNCLTVSNIPSIRASDPKIGIDLSDNGHLASVVERIPSDVEAIYFEFFLDIPEDSEIPLQFKWFFEDKLVQTHSGNHTRGYTIAMLDRDPEIMQNFPSGAYRVEVWFLNTLIVSKNFSVD